MGPQHSQKIEDFGTQNLADLLKKEHQLGVAEGSTGSEWQEGKSWMRLATEDMPIKRYSDLTVTLDIDELVKSECFDQFLLDSPISTHTLFRLHADTVVISAAAAGRGSSSLLIVSVYFWMVQNPENTENRAEIRKKQFVTKVTRTSN